MSDHAYHCDTLDLKPVHKGLGPIKSRPVCFIDTEFTGFPVVAKAGGHFINAYPVDVCALRLKPGTVVPEVYESKVHLNERTRQMFNPAWEPIVGYDPDEWRDAKPLSTVCVELYNFVCGNVWVSHGDADIKLWSHRWSGIELQMSVTTCLPIICTEHMARTLLPGLKSYTLKALCEHFDIEPEQEHRARGGAERCMRIYQKLASISTAR